MPKIGFYVSEEERAWVKAQGPSWFRKTVREKMGAKPLKVPEREHDGEKVTVEQITADYQKRYPGQKPSFEYIKARQKESA